MDATRRLATWTGLLLTLAAAASAAPVDGTGATYGVYGQCTATTAYGYLGYTRFGIYAWTPTTDGVALYGIASSATGTTRGIYGRTASNAGTAVYAVATSTTGATRGVDAQCASDAAIGVYGYAYSATGSTKGVYGRVASTSGTAVYAQATAATGTTYGVYGKVTSGDGWAGYFEGGNGLYTSGFKMPFGHTAGYVLTSDANGVGTWQAAPGSSCWSLTGDAGTTPGTHFLGTTDNQALELHVNGARALLLQPALNSPDLVAGYNGNTVTGGVWGATVSGGGVITELNTVTDHYGSVGGGTNNQAGDDAGLVNDAAYATVSGGRGNTASGAYAAVGGGGGDGTGNTASGDCATVAGGTANQATGDAATIAGGRENIASGAYATIAGGGGPGWGNAASGVCSTVAGGAENTASGDYSVIAGGDDNTASGVDTAVGGGESNSATDTNATVAGGASNTASGSHATVPGGLSNTAAGDYSLAAGRRAQADHQGSFVWADSTNSDFSSAANNRFHARASGGVYLYSNATATSGTYLPAGSGTWINLSDRAAKTEFAPVEPRTVLESLVAIPITTWRYKSEVGARHMGPMAQDLYAAFRLGDSDKAIATIDGDGISMAAIQGLYHIAQERHADKDARITALESALATRDSEIEALRLRLAALEDALKELAK